MKHFLRTKTRTALIVAVNNVHELLSSGDMCDDTDEARRKRVYTRRLCQQAIDLLAEDYERERNKPQFAGRYYNPARDDERLTRQIGRVFEFMADGHWHTIDQIHEGTGDPHNSISAQLRHLRKPQHGSWVIDSEARDPETPSLFYYRMRNPDGRTIPPIQGDARGSNE